MEPDTVVQSETDDDAEVMAAVENGPVEWLVLADVSRDDAYVTLPLEDAATLAAWR